jgi:hypothetical protein
VPLAAGDASERFLLHFNALLSPYQISGQGTASFASDGTFISLTAGTSRIDGKDVAVEWRISAAPHGGLVSVAVSCDDADAPSVGALADQLVRLALANALSDVQVEYFQRRFFSYVGPALSGEFWLPGCRFAPALPDDEEPYRMDYERMVVLDFPVRAIDQNHASVLASAFASAFRHRLALIGQLLIEQQMLERVWVAIDPNDEVGVPSERRLRQFIRPAVRTSHMPRKGELCQAGTYAGSVTDEFAPGGHLIGLPAEMRPLLRLAARALSPDAVALDACARMYMLSLVLRPHSQSASVAYRVAAIDAIVSATKPTFSSVSDFIRRYCPGATLDDAILDHIYGGIRSAHFHAGAVPLDHDTFVPFYPFIGPDHIRNTSALYSSERVTRMAIAAWLKELATKETSLASNPRGADA